MLFDGKEVYTTEIFDYATVRPGDYVTREVVDDAMDCLPPACMSGSCPQMGEPYSHQLDPDTGNWRPTYTTFKRVTGGPDGIWKYCGHCFHGETVERGCDPVYSRRTEG